jgi:hypothetical protein
MYTLEMLTALNTAIAQGVREVYYGDKRVVYRDLMEMLRIRAEMQAALGFQNGYGRKYGSTNKGLL